MTSDPADRGDNAYQEQLGQILRLRDPSALRSFLVQQATTFGDDGQVQAIKAQSDEELEIIMHRMILARTDLIDLHPASQVALGMDPASKRPGPRPQRRRRR
jgi:hypothetical protein